MPPNGYEAVTLPNGLVQQLDDLPGESYTASIRFLIADHKTNGEETCLTPSKK